MKKALEQAEAALAAGEFPVGCVMVFDNKPLATGARTGTLGDCPNEVDHAEIIALKKLSRLNLKVDLQVLAVYSTLEPCLMCFGALMIAGIGRLVYAYEDVMGGGTRCNRAQLPPLYRNNQIEIVSGTLRTESLKLLKTYFSQAQNVYLKESYLAAYTLDQ